jgi:hypothetical protein
LIVIQTANVFVHDVEFANHPLVQIPLSEKATVPDARRWLRRHFLIDYRSVRVRYRRYQKWEDFASNFELKRNYRMNAKFRDLVSINVSVPSGQLSVQVLPRLTVLDLMA